MSNLIREYLPKVKKWAAAYNYLKQKPYPEDRLVMGKLGELLVSFYLFGEDRINWEINWDIKEDKNDGGFDISFQGWSIDVKTTPFFRDPLLKEYVNRSYPPKDVYCLVSLDLEKTSYIIHGFIQSSYFRTDAFLVENWQNLGSRYIAHAQDLFQIVVK